MSEQFWTKNPKILFKKENLSEIWPSSTMSLERKLNSTTRFIILISVLSYLLFRNKTFIFAGLSFLLIIVIYYFRHDEFGKQIKENFQMKRLNSANIEKPSVKNPLMNPLTSDFGTPYRTKHALPNQEYGNLVNENAKEMIRVLNKDNQDKDKLFDNLEKNHEFDTSMRQFTINPSTVLPNDQDDFLKFCYKDLPSNKNINSY